MEELEPCQRAFAARLRNSGFWGMVGEPRVWKEALPTETSGPCFLRLPCTILLHCYLRYGVYPLRGQHLHPDLELGPRVLELWLPLQLW